MLSIGNDELKAGSRVVEGMAIDCPHCGAEHTLRGGTDENGNHSTRLLVYDCGSKTYLAALDGHIIWQFFKRG